MNYFDSPEKSFFKTFAAMKAEADANWIALWGCPHCGPFNTDCLAELWGPPSHYPCPPSGCRSCMQKPQLVPGITPSPPPSAAPWGVYSV